MFDGRATDLVVARLERRAGKLVPYILPVDRLSHLERDLQVSTLDSEVEARLLILDEMEGDLGVSLLLQVADNALSDEVGGTDDLQDLVVVLANEGELESVLGRVNGDGAGLGTSVKTVDNVALDPRKVDGLLERLDDTVVTAKSARCSILLRGRRHTPEAERI